MEIYLDNAATTRVYPQAAETVLKVMREDYGNPSSLHMKGVDAEKYLRDSRETLARLLKVEQKEIVFTSGGSESNNMAIVGSVLANKRLGRHVITTRIEHPSVYNPMEFLREEGYEVTYLPVDEYGLVRLDALKKALRPDTCLVSVMAVNNEIGTIEPLEDIAGIVRQTNPHTLIHVDAIQAFGKMKIYPSRLGIDLMSASGHKFHGPKGTGFLWIKSGTKVHPLILGGGQQKGMRSGTENVPGYAGMGSAARLEFDHLDEKIDRLYELREYFIENVLKIEGTHLNGGRYRGSFSMSQEGMAGHCAAPHIVNISCEDIRAEVLLHALEEKEIYVSSGSACSSNHPQLSGTLKAIGVPRALLDSSLRFSFSYDTDKDQIDMCLQALGELLPVLRRYTPGGRKRR